MPRLPLAVVFAAAFLFLVLVPAGHGQAVNTSGDVKAIWPSERQQIGPAKTGKAFDATYQRPRIMWDLLDFRDKSPTPSRRAIKSVSLIQYAPRKDSLSPHRTTLLQIDSNDPLILKRTEAGFDASVRNTSSDLEPKAFALYTPVEWGVLRVTATDGEFVVYIYEYGFALDTLWDLRSFFWSWTLSRVVDDLYARKAGAHLDRKMLDGLSGEATLRGQQQRYAKECKLLQDIANFTAVLELDRNAVRAYLARAKAKSQLGQFDAAIPDYTRAIELSPGDAMAWFDRGKAYYGQDYRRAIADFTKAIQLNPKFLDAYHWRSLAYSWSGDDTKAEADGERFEELRDELDSAIADYARTIEHSPNDAMAWYGRGRARYFQRDYRRALSDLTKAIQLNPKLVEAYRWRSLAYTEIGDDEKAEADLKTFNELETSLRQNH